MVGIKDFDMPSCCSECQMVSCIGLSGHFYCDITIYDVDVDDTERDADCPLVETIPKAEYEARLKADMVAMLTEIQLEIEESENCGKAFHLGLQMASNIIQQKINVLKENKNGNK